jgi:hypothetical protein
MKQTKIFPILFVLILAALSLSSCSRLPVGDDQSEVTPAAAMTPVEMPEAAVKPTETALLPTPVSTDTPTAIPQPTATPTDAPAAANAPPPAIVAASVAESPTLYADKNYNCRLGPGIFHKHTADILQGTTYPILTLASNGWLEIAIDFPDTRSKTCWIGGGMVQGDLSVVDYYEVPASPLLPIYNFNTFEVIGQLTCSEAARMSWDPEVCDGESGGCWVSSRPLFGMSYAGFRRHEGISICGWKLP